MGIFSGIFGDLFSKKGARKKKRRRGAKRSGSGFRPSDGGAEGSVLVASLFGSGGKEISDYIANMLSTEGSFQTLRLERTLKLNLRVGLLERLLLASDQGSNWIRDEQADLMIWGEMEDMGTVARLRFLSFGASADGQPGTFGMADTLDLPVPIPDGVGDIVRAATMAALLPVTSGSKKELADRMSEVMVGAQKAIEDLAKSVPLDTRVTALNVVGNAFATAVRFGNKRALKGAVKIYETADALIEVKQSPLMWALIQTHLGATLEADARLRKDPLALEAAIARYKGVTDSLGRDEHGYDWALAHVRRAMALYKMATMMPEKSTEHLKAAASAFEEALTVYDKAQMPLRWAEVMNHYGVVQMALGGHGNAEAILQQSISTFRKVLEIRRRNVTPLLWAQTSNNLGAACFALAKRTNEDYLLQEAAACFQGAIQVFRQSRGQKKRAKVIAQNLLRVEQMLNEDEDAA